MAEARAEEPTSASANATEETKVETQEPEEQIPLVEETYNEAVASELKFRCEWTLWEHYECPESPLSYADGMCKACWFNDMVSFAIAWNSVPHRNLANIFYNEQSRSVRL